MTGDELVVVGTVVWGTVGVVLGRNLGFDGILLRVRGELAGGLELVVDEGEIGTGDMATRHKMQGPQCSILLRGSTLSNYSPAIMLVGHPPTAYQPEYVR